MFVRGVFMAIASAGSSIILRNQSSCMAKIDAAETNGGLGSGEEARKEVNDLVKHAQLIDEQLTQDINLPPPSLRDYFRSHSEYELWQGRIPVVNTEVCDGEMTAVGSVIRGKVAQQDGPMRELLLKTSNPDLLLFLQDQSVTLSDKSKIVSVLTGRDALRDYTQTIGGLLDFALSTESMSGSLPISIRDSVFSYVKENQARDPDAPKDLERSKKIVALLRLVRHDNNLPENLSE